MNNYIGIDLGTSSVKLILTDSNGNVRRSVSKMYPVSFPRAGWSEQNPEDWYARTMDGLRELLDGTDRKRVRAIGFGGQMHGLVMLDKDDNVIRPAILWNDGRSSAQVRFLNDVIGKSKLSELTGNIAFAGFTAPKLLWVRENEPDNFSKIVKIMLPKDYLCYRLSGIHCTDPSDASGTLLFDVKNRRWSKDMLEICGIGDELLPEVYESRMPVGCLKPETAAQLGLGAAVIAAGASDNAAAAIAAGTVKEGLCNISLGTSGTILIPSERFIMEAGNALHSFAHANGRYLLMGCMLSAASCGSWWCEDILKTSDYDGEQRGFSVDGENGVYFLPYLMGERSPHNDENARGVFFGMRMDTTRAQMTQAVFEGVSFGLRDSLEAARAMGIRPSSSTLCGGGAVSGAWRRMIADVMNMDILIPKGETGPAMGGAMLAATAFGEFPDVWAAAERMTRTECVVRPEPEAVAGYERRYAFFKTLYPALRERFVAATRV
jgi:xylulokinase